MNIASNWKKGYKMIFHQFCPFEIFFCKFESKNCKAILHLWSKIGFRTVEVILYLWNKSNFRTVCSIAKNFHENAFAIYAKYEKEVSLHVFGCKSK